MSNAVWETLSLTVVTRDSWTTRPDFRASSTSQRIGLTERNLLGTGRTVASISLAKRSLGAGVTTFDALVRTGMTRALSTTSIRMVRLARSRSRAVSESHDKWRGELDLYDQQYEPKDAVSDNFERAVRSCWVAFD